MKEGRRGKKEKTYIYTNIMISYSITVLFFFYPLAFCVFMCYNKNKVVLYMKKYSWLALIAFTLALIVCIVIASKNEAVRDTFMKATQDIPYFAEQCAISFKTSLFGRI